MRWIHTHTARIVLIGTIVTGGCVTSKKYNALQARYDALESQHTELREQAQGMRVEIDDLEEYVDLLRQSNEHLGSFYADLLDEFKPQLDNEDVELIVYPDRMSLALKQDVSFNSGSANLSQTGDETLGKLSDLVQRHPERRFVVEGHTDSRPINTMRYRNNWELGAARAVAVIEKLIEQGVPADRLAAVSYGDTEPLAPNDTPESQTINRRVEVSFQPTLEELPGHRSLVNAAKQVTLAEGASESVVPELDDEVRRVGVGEGASE